MARTRRQKRTPPRAAPAPAPLPRHPGPLDARERRLLLLVTGAMAALLLPFLDTAFRIDDPLFLWAARRIQAHPFDPYGFSVNWYGSAMAMADVTKNPPLASYYTAAVAHVIGWSEPALHAAFVLPAVAVAAGMFLLARRWCANPAVAVVAGLATPVFLVSSVTVMCDVLMLACWVWAVHFWITGLDRSSHVRLGVASLLIVAAALSKYFGMALLPLLIVYTAVRERRAGAWMLHFIGPVVALAAYESVTHRLYGRGLLLDAAVYATDVHTTFDKLSIAKTYVTLAFTGGCLATLACLAPRLWSRASLAAGLACGAIAAVVLAAAPAIGGFTMPVDAGAHWLIAGQLALWAVTGASLLALAVLDYNARRDADSLLLLMWTIGTFAFAGFVNWSTNGRSILPIAVPAGILIARRLERRATPRRPAIRAAAAPLAVAAAIALCVAWADAALAGTARAGAGAIFAKYRQNGRTIWFQGHWGFQYYMEALGAKPLDFGSLHLVQGDIIVTPTTNSNLAPLGKGLTPEVIDVPSSRWLSTMNLPNGAGFYSDVFGPLPFALGPVPPERFSIFVVLRSAK